MFSFQPHHQVLYHLTQLTSIAGPKSTSFSVKTKRQNEIKRTMDNISSNNMTEATKNYTDTLAGKLNTINLTTMLDIKTNNILIVLDQLSTKIVKKNLEKNKWKVSYVPGLNFTENKPKFSCTELRNQTILPTMFLSSKQHYRTLCTFCIKNPFNYHVQVRGFKTKRTINAELERKSLFINTLKKWVTQLLGTKSTIPNDKNYALMKKLLDNTQSTMDERRNFMFAFVHGYNVGLQTRPRPIYIAIKTFLIFIAVISLIYVLSTGSAIRLPLDSGRYRPQTTNVTFDDVKGIPEAKGEVLDIVEFLKNPEKFAALGAKLPKGVLLVGPPGTGKTLLARAIAGEAGVPFFQAAGPEFDEVLVGQGARRLRDLFRAARDRAPSVIFIDEIDSVASKRVNSSYHPYANQTINQLLTEMDGFLQNEGVIVLGATNRRDVLDAALTRPGRFDVEVTVQRPDYISRKEIFDLYLSKVLTKDVDSDRLARSTIGFTGADIENMVNQAALRAAINNSEYVTMKHLDYAKDKLIMGIERKVKITDAETNTITAYHEAGHALVAYYTSDARPIYKITILAHTRSLGHTEFLQNKDEYFDTKSKLLAEMDAAMGGRAAEELVFGSEKVTSGAQSDFEKATAIAESMVNLYGMSEKAGLVIRRQQQNEGYLPGPTSDDLASSEVKRLIQESYERAKMILQKHSKELHAVAEALLKYETLTKEDMTAVINGENIPKPVNSPTNVL